MRGELLLLLILFCSSVSAAELIVHFPLDGDSEDIIQGINISSDFTYVEGVIGEAVLFDGRSVGVIAQNDIFNFGQENFSIALWFRYHDTEEHQSMISNHWSVVTGNGGVSIGIRDKRIVLMHRGSIYDSVEAGPLATDGRWHHFAGVRDGDKNYAYLDGKFIGLRSGVGDLKYSSDLPIVVGAQWADRENGDVKLEYKGEMDDIRFYRGTLTAEEIAAMVAPYEHVFSLPSVHEPVYVNQSMDEVDPMYIKDQAQEIPVAPGQVKREDGAITIPLPDTITITTPGIAITMLIIILAIITLVLALKVIKELTKP